MGLASALTTALTGLTAAETQIDVVGNNLANSQTVGFKASQAVFATQFLQTLGLGSAPTENTGGTNPRQTGLGTQVAEVTPDFTQGTIEISSNPSDLAIQGDGFFIVEGSNGESLYTRNGVLKTNAQNELVTTTGNRLLGFGVDEFFNIQETELTPLTIPLGSSAVAQATQNVFLEGTLTPTGDVADTAQVIQSSVLGNAAIPRPSLTANTDASKGPIQPTVGISVSAAPDFSAVTSAAALQPDITAAGTAAGQLEDVPAAGTHTAGDTFRYRFTFGTAGSATETLASDEIVATVLNNDANPANDGIRLSNLPTSGSFSTINVYRTAAGGTDFFLLETVTNTGTYDDNNSVALTANALNPALVNGTGADGNFAGGEVFQYRFTFVDDSGTESLPTEIISRTVPGAGTDDVAKSIVLSNIPNSTTYASVNVYRTADGGSTFYKLDNIPVGTGTYVDDGSITLDTSASNQLTQTTLDGNYTYLVTYSAPGVPESRPSLIVGGSVQTVSGGAIRITNLPQIPTAPSDGSFPQYTTVNVYRNLANDSSTFYLVGSAAAGEDFTDSRTDAAISDLTNTNNKKLDLDGPKADSTTLLKNIVRRDGLDFESQFTTGTLSFTGRKGGRSLDSKTLDITDTTTLGELMAFMQEALGIQAAATDSQNNIPGSLNNIVGDTSGPTLEQGISVIGGKLRIVSNNGVDNAVSVGLSSFQLTNDVGSVSNPTLSFGTVQEAKGQSAVTDFLAFDSLGVPVSVRLTVVMEARTGTSTTYRWYADSPDNDPIAGLGDSAIAVGTGLVSFDGEGNFISATNSTVSIERRNSPASSPLEFELDFSKISGLAADKASIAASRQDGSSTGTLTSFIIGEDGVIRGVFSNGATRDLGQVVLARFGNPAGLVQVGQNMFAAGVNSGLPVTGNPGQSGIGAIIAGAVELSNTDIGQNLIDLVLATTQYRGNTRVITAAQQLLDELLNLRR